MLSPQQLKKSRQSGILVCPFCKEPVIAVRGNLLHCSSQTCSFTYEGILNDKLAPLIIILNHKPTGQQLKELINMGYQPHYFEHPKIPADWEKVEVFKYFVMFNEEILKQLGIEEDEKLAYWVQGDYRFFSVVYHRCSSRGYPLFVATTERKVEESIEGDVVKKVSVFKHVKFVNVTEGV